MSFTPAVPKTGQRRRRTRRFFPISGRGNIQYSLIEEECFWTCAHGYGMDKDVTRIQQQALQGNTKCLLERFAFTSTNQRL